MNARLLALLSLSLVTVAVGAQTSNPGPVPYVDMSTAQTLVETLQRENETLSADMAALKKQIVGLGDQITSARKAIDDFTPLLDEVKARTGELTTLLDELVDRGLRAKAVVALDKTKAAQKKVQQRLDELGALAAALPKQIEGLQFQVAVDQAKVGRNNDDIVVLQATIARTKLQEARLNALLTDVDATTGKVDSYLQQSGVGLGAATATPKK